MMRPQSKRCLNVRPLLLLLLTATLIGSMARTVEAQVEARKSRWAATGLSFLITGAGQAYNGQWAKGGLMLGGQVVSLGVVVRTADDCIDTAPPDCGVFAVGLIAAVGIWLWSMIDAHLTVNAINRRIDAGQVALEIGPQLMVPQSRSAMSGLRPSWSPSFHRNSRIDLSLVRVRL